MPRAVIFDMDGLLIDSEPFWRRAHKEVLAARGITISDTDLYDMAGKGTDVVLAEWAERYGWDPKDDAQIELDIDRQVLNLVRQEGTALPGAVALAHELRSREMPLAVASSSSPEMIRTVLERLGITALIGVVQSAKQVARGKPWPDVFLAAAQHLGVPPEKCLVFEDSLTGVKAAKAAGMKCIVVPEEPYDRAAFEALTPARIMTSLADIHWADIHTL